MTGVQLTRPLMGQSALAAVVALFTLATIASSSGLATTGHHQHPHFNQAPPPAGFHPQGPPPAGFHHPQAPNNIAPSHPNPIPTDSGTGAGAGASTSSGLTSNAGKIIAAGALMGALGSQLPSHNRQTRHLVEGPKKYVDLSHPLHNGTLHWPSMSDFQYSTMTDGERKNKQGQSYYIKADSISASIHSGTHLDAPRHFSKTGWTVEQIPLERLIDVPVTVVDVSEKVKAARSYNFVKADFLDAKTNESLVQPNSVVLVYTGVSQAYDQGKEAYMGTASANISEMKIPGFSEEAAKYLVERGVFGVGLDSPSADSSEQHGTEGMESFNPVAHVILNSNNIYILENINSKLSELVNVQGARLTIAPLPIVGGSGSQVRLVAIIGHDECHCHDHDHGPSNSSPLGDGYYYSSLTILITTILSVVLLLI